MTTWVVAQVSGRFSTRHSARGFRRGLRPAEERKRAGQTPTTLHRSFARARLRAAARAVKTRLLTRVEGVVQVRTSQRKPRIRKAQ
jgi:hypothetical protein